MKVVRMNDVPKQPATSPLFTGPNVTRQALAPESEHYNVGIVNFGVGTRNKWHTHESDQLLIVTGGKGFVATEQEEREVTVGDFVFVPAGEKHWHGAGADSEFSHIAITLASSKTTQLED